MENSDIIREVIQLIPLASSYINSLDISKVVGQEIVKENVKKFYSWIIDKFKQKNKESDIKAFAQDKENAKLEGKVEATIESILENKYDKEYLMGLLREVKPILMSQKTIQINQGDNNTTNFFETVKGDVIIGYKKIYKK